MKLSALVCRSKKWFTITWPTMIKDIAELVRWNESDLWEKNRFVFFSVKTLSSIWRDVNPSGWRLRTSFKSTISTKAKTFTWSSTTSIVSVEWWDVFWVIHKWRHGWLIKKSHFKEDYSQTWLQPDFGSNEIHVTQLQYSFTFLVLLMEFNYIFDKELL